MKAGPKPAASRRALPSSVDAAGVPPEEACAAWLARWVRVPRGTGAGGPLILRPWQRRIVGELLDPPTRLAVFVAGRGNGKSGLAAGLALHHIVTGELGATAAVVATDERAAARLLRTATLIVERSPSLTKRLTVYADRIVFERTGGEFLVLPAEMRRVEGSDLTLAIADEVGLMERPVWESLVLSLKREGARALAIGTPSPAAWRERAPLLDLVTAGRAGDDPSLRLIEYGSDDAHPLDCEHCWESANPGYGDLLDPSQLASSLPPRTRAVEYARARLARWVSEDVSAWLPAEAWAACAEPGDIPDGVDVVIGFDGSFSQDCTAVVAATVSPRPHVQLLELWEPPLGDDGTWRVPIADVEAAIVDAAKRWRVREIACDPFRWQRSMQALERTGLPVVEYPQSAARMTPATVAFGEAVHNRQLTHTGDRRLARHVGNAVLREDERGARLSKTSKKSPLRIDAAVAALMVVSRAAWWARQAPPKKKRFVTW